MSDVEELARAASAGGRQSSRSLLHHTPEPQVRTLLVAAEVPRRLHCPWTHQ